MVEISKKIIKNWVCQTVQGNPSENLPIAQSKAAQALLCGRRVGNFSNVVNFQFALIRILHVEQVQEDII